jgi:TolB protein
VTARLGPVAAVCTALAAAPTAGWGAAAEVRPRGPTAPSWTPAGEIVFAARNGVFAVRPDASRLRRLSPLGREDSYPSPSPQGVVAFQAADALWIVRTDGSGARRIRRESTVEASFSPDGSRIAFSDGGVLQIMSADGRGARTVERYVTDLGGSPAWSPDGRRLAYMTCVRPGSPACERFRNQAVYVVNRDGTGKRRVSARSGPIQCVSWRGPGVLYLWDETDVYAAGRGGDRRIFRGSDSCPVWSPDGRHIAVFRHSGLALVTPAGRARTVARFSGLVLPPALPAWSPDSRRLAFVRAFLKGPNRLYVVNATGGRPRRLA